jgi:DNA mismatch repair protein MSH4
MYTVGAALKYDNGRMYWLRIKAANLDDEILPDIFINPVRKRQYFECQTLLLAQLNRRLSEVSDDVVMRSDSVIWDLVKQLQRNASHLFQVAESVALIDMLASFAHATTTYDYKRPEITGTLALRRAHHPILHKV